MTHLVALLRGINVNGITISTPSSTRIGRSVNDPCFPPYLAVGRLI